MHKLYHGDCLAVMDRLISEGVTVDAVITDPPYGNMKGVKLGGWDESKTEWDTAISPIDIFKRADKLLRQNGKMILFSQEPYTSRLITNALPNLPFNYRAVWEKYNFANCLLAKKAMVSYFEDILIFAKKHDSEGLHPLRPYFKQVLDFVGLGLKKINEQLGHGKAEHTFYVTPKKAIIGEIGQKADHVTRHGSSQFGLCTKETYTELMQVFKIDQMDGCKCFEELEAIDETFKKEFPSTFNLWQGKSFKSNILKYKKDCPSTHPTQKPVRLMEDLILTFTNENELVLDFTMGSGTTGYACKKTKRDFIGIEQDPTYFAHAKKRIEGNIQNDLF